jgi:hypothetical protein
MRRGSVIGRPHTTPSLIAAVPMLSVHSRWARRSFLA